MRKNCSFQSSIVFLVCRRLHSKELSIHTYWNCHLEWLRNISCIVLYCSYIKLYFRCNKWSNELHNVNSARPSGLAKYYHRSEPPVLITSRLKIKLILEQKVRRFEGRLSAESLIRNVRYWKRGIIYIASVFKVLQSCDAGRLAGKFYVADHSSSAMSSCHKAFAVFRASS